MPSQWALPLPHRTGQSSPRRRFVHAVFTALDRNHVLDVLPDQLTAGQAAVSPLDQARVEAPRGHAPVDVGPRIEQLHLSVIVNLMNAAVGTNPPKAAQSVLGDRKSTRLNSSHVAISYAVFCLKKNNNRL